MYTISETHPTGFHLNIVLLFKCDDYKEAYDGHSFSGQTALEIIQKGDNRTHVKPENINKLLEDIRNSKSHIEIPHGHNIYMSTIGVNKKELAKIILETKRKMENITSIESILEDIVIVKKETTDNSTHWFWEPISYENYNHSVIFNEISISAKLILNGFNIDKHTKTYDRKYFSCHYCGKAGSDFKIYKLINPDVTNFKQVCDSCKEKIQKKCRQLEQDEALTKKIIANTI